MALAALTMSPTTVAPCLANTSWHLVTFHCSAGHDILMATMLNGAAVMDGALLLIAANESCPQPQTLEHLAAVEIMRLQHIIILQNKIDLIRCCASVEEIFQSIITSLSSRMSLPPAARAWRPTSTRRLRQ